MDTEEKNDQPIIELFSASRQVDRASASDFRTLLGSARTRRRGRRRVGTTPRRLLALSLATTAAGALLAVASYSFLLERTDRMGGLAKPASMASIGNYRTRTEVGVVGGAVSGVAGEAPLVSVARARDFKGTANGSLDLQKLQSLGYMQGPGGTFMSNITPDAIEGSGGFNTESYGLMQENDFLAVMSNPLSTFSIDVDTASYANVRRFLNAGRLPPAAAVRIEELVNYFPYDYSSPAGEAPFAVSVEIAGCPWNPRHRLARIGLKAEEIRRPPRGSNLVFLIDVSGSMAEPDKLPLATAALKQLVQELDGRDRIAIVVYAGASGLVLSPTSGDDKSRIIAALDRLQAGGSTNGAEGLELAYRIAKENFISGGVNRVILATDGDFNVGVTDRGELLRLIKRDADEGIFLTTLGFGMGNLKDDMLETLADKGNGNYAYIDSLGEARRVLVEQMGGTLITVAKDVKVQVEFNPVLVGTYRLIGYENRVLPKEHFNDDTKDAGEIGSGHTVTALYELVPAGMEDRAPSVDPLKYQTPATVAEAARAGETLTVKLRYKEPEGKQSRLLEFPAFDRGLPSGAASADFKFASAVAMFGMILRDSPHKGETTLDLVSRLSSEGAELDPGGYRAEFRQLVARAMPLARALPGTDRPKPRVEE